MINRQPGQFCSVVLYINLKYHVVSCSLRFPDWTFSVSPQKSSGEVTLKDCLRLFTKEDVLDGEERPVRSLHTPRSFVKRRYIVWIIQRQYLTALSVFDLSLSDVQQMQNQKKMHQKIQHSEVPSDPRDSYPFLTSLHHLFSAYSLHVHLNEWTYLHTLSQWHTRNKWLTTFQV